MELACFQEVIPLGDALASDNGSGFSASPAAPLMDKQFDLWELCNDINQAIDHLDDREQQIIYLRFFCQMSQAEVASYLRISQAHVSRLQQKALDRLKQLLDDG